MEVETIYSDQEVDATSSEEEEQVEEPAKKNKNKKQKTLFDDLTENEPIENSSSWDFTQAIQTLKNEKSNSKQTTLDEKIRRAVEGRKIKESKGYEAVDHKEDTKDGLSESDKSASEDELENSTGKTRPLYKEKTKEQIRKHQTRLSSFAELQLSRPLGNKIFKGIIRRNFSLSFSLFDFLKIYQGISIFIDSR